MEDLDLRQARERGLSALLLVLLCLVAPALTSVTPAFAEPATGLYVRWEDVATMTAQGTSPHGGYATTTVKCAVCHSVHAASVAVSIGDEPELLMASSVANSCTYCHVGGAGGYSQVYGGDPANYRGTNLSNAHNSFDNTAGVEQGVTCIACHQVHAADSVMTANAYLTQKMLKGAKTYSSDPVPNYDPIAGAPASTDDSDTALAKWCAGCHFTRAGTYTYYSDDYNQPSHIMTTATASYGNPDATYRGTVAWLGSNYCASCHGSAYQTSEWPHYTPGMRFLLSAEGATATVSGAASAKQDGVCLRCHRNGESGIGISF